MSVVRRICNEKVYSVTKTHFRTISVGSKNYNKTLSPLTQLTGDEAEMQKTVSKFASEHIKPYVKEMDNNHKYNQSVIDMLFKDKIIGLTLNPKYGGSGRSFMTNIIAIEEISKVDPAVAVLVNVQNSLITKLINKYGSEKQKIYYLPALTEKMVGSFCLSESTSGSDAFSLTTTAKKDGSDYIINGRKMWSSNADIADVFIIMANINPAEGYRGITCFIVEKGAEGLSVLDPKTKMGIRASGTCSVNLDNVRVSALNVLGEIGQGYKYIAASLNESRIGVAAQMVGLAQGAFDATIRTTLEEKPFLHPMFNFQAMQHQISHIATQIECGRLLTYNAARLVDRGENVIKQAAMAKFYAAEVATQTTIKCIDWMGRAGLSKDFPQEKYFRDCKIGSMYEGTHNIQLNTIAKSIAKEYN